MHLVAAASISYLAKNVGVSRYVLSHWLAKRSVPSLDHILRLIGTINFGIVEFVGALVDLRTMPSLKAEIAEREQRKFGSIMLHPA